MIPVFVDLSSKYVSCTLYIWCTRNAVCDLVDKAWHSECLRYHWMLGENVSQFHSSLNQRYSLQIFHDVRISVLWFQQKRRTLNPCGRVFCQGFWGDLGSAMMPISDLFPAAGHGHSCWLKHPRVLMLQKFEASSSGIVHMCLGEMV